VGVTAAERSTVALPAGKLALVLHVPDAPGAVPCVVACHGLAASKDSDKYLLLGRELPRAGLALARFDFRGAGESTGREDETTIATRIEDLNAVLATLEAHPRLDGRFGLLGSSLGGFVALFVAAERGLSVVTWNAPSELSGLAGRTDAPAIGGPLRAELAAGTHRRAPAGVARHLVVQGDRDEVVDPAHGRALHRSAVPPCEMALIRGGDHRLSDMPHRLEAVTRSRDWFRRFFA
jgi:pimeloyl-ACP methyl ester carboxylesterase